MDIIAAYRDVGTFRGAAELTGTTHKTVRRVIARHESGGGAPVRAVRGRNYDCVAGLVAERVEKTSGRISSKRLLPAARAAGCGGSDRNFRRLNLSAGQTLAQMALETASHAGVSDGRAGQGGVAGGAPAGPPAGGLVAG